MNHSGRGAHERHHVARLVRGSFPRPAIGPSVLGSILLSRRATVAPVHLFGHAPYGVVI